jgi:hypothetical protein
MTAKLSLLGIKVRAIPPLNLLFSRWPFLQILGQLIGGNPSKATQVLGHFKDAATKAQDDAGIWEVLGELSAATDPQGKW